jgi:integrase
MVEIPLTTPIFEADAANLEQQHRASTTVYRNRSILSRLEQWAKGRGIDPQRLTPMDMNEYVNGVLADRSGDQLPLSPVTRHGHLICIRAAYQWAIDVDLADGKNPCRRLRVFRRYPQPYFLSNAELRGILTACVTEDEYLVAATLTFSGLRLFELAALRWEPTTGRDRRDEEMTLPGQISSEARFTSSARTRNHGPCRFIPA